MTELVDAGIGALSARLAAGDTTSRAATEAYLARIAQHDGKMNSFLAVTTDLALELAEAADRRRRDNKRLGPLDGVPMALKDNIDVAGIATTAGIGARRGRIAQTDAAVVAQLKAAGAVILGKTNMHEGAHGATTANEAFGDCHNPHRHGFTPGGSSGGSGAALAAGLAAGALGTDTLGSLRIPASYCGIAALKPTRGLISTRGVVPLCFELDHVGPMARTVADLAMMLPALAQYDAADAMARPAAAFDLHIGDTVSLKGVRIGRVPELDAPVGGPVPSDISDAYETALAVLKGLGAVIVDTPLSGLDHQRTRARALLMLEADLTLIHGEDLARHPEGFSRAFREGVEYGRKQSAEKLAAAYAASREVRALIRRILETVDALVTPTTPNTAFAFSQPMPKTVSVFTGLANHAGTPAVSVPMGWSKDRLPLGLQVMTREWEDARALRIAAAYERAAGWRMRPEGY